MAYDRKRSGRKAVSFPVESDDWMWVNEMVRKVEDRFKRGEYVEVKF